MDAGRAHNFTILGIFTILRGACACACVTLSACAGAPAGGVGGVEPDPGAERAGSAGQKPRQPVADRSQLSAIDRMLLERNERGRPSIPGYKLVREAEEALERQERILNVLKGRLRSAQKAREYGKIACIRDNLARLRKLYERTGTETHGIEQALRKRDRARAEELWLRVRVADMQAREFIHGRCTNEAHVEVEMTAPGGVRKFSGSTSRRGKDRP